MKEVNGLNERAVVLFLAIMIPAMTVGGHLMAAPVSGPASTQADVSEPRPAKARTLLGPRQLVVAPSVLRKQTLTAETTAETTRSAATPAPEDKGNVGSGASAEISCGSDQASAPKSRHFVQGVQRKLLELGHDPGPIDGLLGEQTRDAVAAFQKDRNMPVDGCMSLALDLELVRILKLEAMLATMTARADALPARNTSALPAGPVAAGPVTPAPDIPLLSSAEGLTRSMLVGAVSVVPQNVMPQWTHGVDAVAESVRRLAAVSEELMSIMGQIGQYLSGALIREITDRTV